VKAEEKQVGGDHYKSMAIQPHYFCWINKLGPLESNAIKYLCRYKAKGGKQDLEKAIHYIQLLMDWEFPSDPIPEPYPGDGRFG